MLDEMQMAASCSCVERRPLLAVFGVDVRTEFEQQFHHFLIIVDATLKHENARG